MACFNVKYEMGDRGLSTLFKHKIFTIFTKDRKNWDYSKLDQYLIEYKLSISQEVMQKYQDTHEINTILKEMIEEPFFFKINNNRAIRYTSEKQYIKCTVPVNILSLLKKLFISTLVYDAEKMGFPNNEFIEFEFNSDNQTVTVIDLHLYIPKDNPFFRYARNAVSSLSVEAIGLEKYYSDNVKDVKNFYDLKQISKWKEKKYLNKETGIDDKPGVYMLYDSKNNTFYVGKAIRLKERIKQHMKNINAPIPNFTHYRYSVIYREYYEFLYLIENAAIHDAAWIMNMPKAQKYKPSLTTEAKKFGQNISDCKIVNTQEHQIRKQ